jgi:uronate dehydrogenase
MQVLLTGAAGTLGRVVTPALAERYGSLVVTDLADIPGALPPGVRFERADLRDATMIARLAQGMDAIVHFGGINTEKSFESILEGNIVGTVNVFEAARAAGARVVYASSNHTIGFYRRGEHLTAASPGRPDGFYGLSKLYCEMLGRLYFDKHGVESVHLRIGSCLPRPTDARHLATWLSYPDLVRLATSAIEAPSPGCALVWGISANSGAWWDGDDAERIGYAPTDDAETYREEIPAVTKDEGTAALYQGGPFTAREYRRE